MPDESLHIRPATRADLPAINDIYNHYVSRSTCTYQEQAETIEARRTWFAEHGARHPVFVAESLGRVIGWACLGPFRAREGYRFTVENSVYVHHDHHGKGVGSMLLRRLIEAAGELGYHTIVAGCDSSQEASIRLHVRLGFVQVAHFREIGFKFGRRLDVVFLQRMLGNPPS